MIPLDDVRRALLGSAAFPPRMLAELGRRRITNATAHAIAIVDGGRSFTLAPGASELVEARALDREE